MSALAEIETAADFLSSEEKEQLLRFLAMRLRKERALPKARIYSQEELGAMIAEDEGRQTRAGRVLCAALLSAARPRAAFNTHRHTLLRRIIERHPQRGS